MKNSTCIKKYLSFVYAALLTVFFLRFIEIILLTLKYGWLPNAFLHEFLGFIFDCFVVCPLLLFYYPIFCWINRKSTLFSKILSSFLLFVFGIAHILIMAYFIYEKVLLDTFLYSYTLEEIYFTTSTSNLPLFKLSILIFGIGLLFVLLYLWLSKRAFSRSKYTLHLLMVGTISSILLLFYPLADVNPYLQNKSSFFYANSLVYFLSPPIQYEQLTPENVKAFHARYSKKEFISNDYPLLHLHSKEDKLGEYLEAFDTVPNIVILYVEGLSDEYIHNYHGIDLMPFLSGLKDSSLYWNHCFTLGERSFAVIPSILGGLPYGDKGFTLLKNYPRHHSLYNLLKARGFHTAFYTGGANWFHSKGKFYQYNRTDWIFDQMNFDDSFEKIFVGDDHFFVGYNDLDLFHQYFKTLDTIPNTPFIHTFFTGTSHPPYIYPNKENYLKRLAKFKHKENKSFIRSYANYLASFFFVDDAIREFMTIYQERPEFKNTIFIITGDHPTSELPRINELTKYHVPMIIYSPNLKKSNTFNHTVSHLDVSTTLLSYLGKSIPDLPETTTSLGYSLFDDDTSIVRNYVFMDGNRGMYEYYSNGYFLRKKHLYSVGNDWSLTPIKNDEKKEELKAALENFKTINYRVSFTNRLMDNTTYAKGLKRKVLFEHNDTSTVISSDYFINLIPTTEIRNVSFSVELNLEIERFIKSDALIVVQVKDKNDSIISWQSGGISHKDSYQYYFDYKSFPIDDSTFYFSAYIWNDKQEEIEFKNTDVLLWQ